MSWRELMKVEPYTQYPQYPQKESLEDGFDNIENIGNRNKTVKAAGYGCGSCGHRIYRAVQAWEITTLSETACSGTKHTPVTHWQCEGCESIYEIIGGTRGPQNIN